MTTHQAEELDKYQVQDLENWRIKSKLEKMFSEEQYDANYLPF